MRLETGMADIVFLGHLTEWKSSDALFWDLRDWTPEKRADGQGYDLFPTHMGSIERDSNQRIEHHLKEMEIVVG